MPEFFKQVGAARFGVMAGVAAVLTAFFLYIAGAITESCQSIHICEWARAFRSSKVEGAPPGGPPVGSPRKIDKKPC